MKKDKDSSVGVFFFGVLIGTIFTSAASLNLDEPYISMAGKITQQKEICTALGSKPRTFDAYSFTCLNKQTISFDNKYQGLNQ
jgi:hypothetical protein